MLNFVAGGNNQRENYNRRVTYVPSTPAFGRETSLNRPSSLSSELNGATRYRAIHVDQTRDSMKLDETAIGIR